MNSILIDDIDKIHNAVSPRTDYSDCAILITGCAGFVGFYLLNYFTRYGKSLGIKKVIGLDIFLHGKPQWLSSLESEYPGLLLIECFNIASDDLDRIQFCFDIDYVIHAASIASPSFYRKYPIETIDANVWGLRNLLDHFSQKNRLRGFLYFSSSEIYGDPDTENLPTSEDYRGSVSCVGPRACYDESKRLCETLCSIYATKFQLPITVVRPFNNFGPGMSVADKRLPADLAAKIIANEDIVLHSDGLSTRTFCYISDATIGYLLCLSFGKYETFNIGCDGPEITVLEFAQLFRDTAQQLFQYTGDIRLEPSADPDYVADNPRRRCPSIRKARELLAFSPSVSISEGVWRFLSYVQKSLDS